MSQKIKPSTKKPVIKKRLNYQKNRKKVKTKCMEKIRKKFSPLGIPF